MLNSNFTILRNMKKGDFIYVKTPSATWVSIFDYIDKSRRIQAIFSIELAKKVFYTEPKEYQKWGTRALTKISNVCECRLATPEEQDTLLDVLGKAGFRYDNLTMKLVPK